MEHSGEGFLLSSLLASTISICSRRKAALLGPCPCVAISSSDSLPGWSCEFGPFASYGVEGGARSQPSLGIGSPLVGRTLACCSWSWADTNWDKGLGRTNRNLSQNSLAELSTGTAHPNKPLIKTKQKRERQVVASDFPYPIQPVQWQPRLDPGPEHRLHSLLTVDISSEEIFWLLSLHGILSILVPQSVSILFRLSKYSF
jgi:hypothetical protein